jgi:hypothetical protein
VDSKQGGTHAPSARDDQGLGCPVDRSHAAFRPSSSPSGARASDRTSCMPTRPTIPVHPGHLAAQRISFRISPAAASNPRSASDATGGWSNEPLPGSIAFADSSSATNAAPISIAVSWSWLPYSSALGSFLTTLCFETGLPKTQAEGASPLNVGDRALVLFRELLERVGVLVQRPRKRGPLCPALASAASALPCTRTSRSVDELGACSVGGIEGIDAMRMRI